jgi:hypothetical protein
MSEKRKDVHVVVPVSADEEGVTDVSAYFPAMMTEGEWAQFHRVLEAMKPALVVQLAQVQPDRSE